MNLDPFVGFGSLQAFRIRGDYHNLVAMIQQCFSEIIRADRAASGGGFEMLMEDEDAHVAKKGAKGLTQRR